MNSSFILARLLFSPLSHPSIPLLSAATAAKLFVPLRQRWQQRVTTKAAKMLQDLREVLSFLCVSNVTLFIRLNLLRLHMNSSRSQ